MESRPYQKIVLVCVHGRTCPRQGSLETCDKLREGITASDLRDQIRIVKSGCLAQCGHGPIVAIEPEGAWYRNVTASEAPEFLAGPVIQGTSMERLQYRPKNPGKNIIPPDEWVIPPSG